MLSRRRILHRLVVVLGVALASTVVVPGIAHADPTHRLVDADRANDGGVFYRNSPRWADTSRTPGIGLHYGEAGRLICGTWGDAVGPYANRRWHKVQNLSRDVGIGWIPDRYFDTPNAANQPTPGERECTDADLGIAPPPAAPAADDRVERALADAFSHNGQPHMRMRCLEFVATSYSNTGWRLAGPYGEHVNAVDWWHTDLSPSPRHPGDTNPPRGALVYWSTFAGGAGHAAIALGDGTAISTQFGGDPNVHVFRIADFPQHYLGWRAPA